MFEDLISGPEKLFDQNVFNGMDGECVYHGALSSIPLIWEDCPNYEPNSDTMNCRFYIPAHGECTFHRY